MIEPTTPPSPLEVVVLKLTAKIDALTDEVNNLRVNTSCSSTPRHSNTPPQPH